MKDNHQSLRPVAAEKRLICFVTAAWIGLIGLLLFIGWRQTQKNVFDLAVVEARASIDKDLLFRRWATMHGGVYVPPTDTTPPNPHLSHIPDRDVITTEGKRLTLINPAYMTRQIHELAEQQYGTRGHLTSLNPIRLENGADPWEAQAMQAFQSGRTEEISSMTIMDGQPFLRFIKPMVTEKGCLRCHAAQGYREGDIRGGISVSIPFTPYLDIAGKQKRHLLIVHGIITLLGACGIWYAGGQILRSRRELRSERNRLQDEHILFAAGPVFMISWSPDPQWPVTFVTENIEQILGFTPEEMTAPDFRYTEHIHPDDLELVVSDVKHAIASGKERFAQRFRLRSKSGEYHLFSNFTLLIRDSNGAVEKILGYMFDDRERKLAEIERERLLSAIQQTTESIVITDPEGTIQYVNPAFERTTGYASEEAIGQNPRCLKSGEHDELFYKEMWDTLVRGESWSGRIVNRKKDGTLYTEDAIISPVTDVSGKTRSYVAVKHDISRKIQLEKEKASIEEQYRQAQKVESIGRLAGGVAHDLNNLLSPIIGYGEILQHNMAPDDGRRDMVDAILNAGFRARDLVRQLLAFSRKQTLEFKTVEINRVITGFGKLLRQSIPEDIEIAFFLSSDSLTVMADIGQMEQILMNLAVNAADAMPEGGRLTIETSQVILDEKYAAAHASVKPGPFVLLAISDTGCGMDDKTRKSIFEPFFSTKGKHGTGMGLATVYGIVKQHNGNIWVYSEPGQGSTFKIYLPLCKTAHVEETAGKQELTDLTGNETILLAEDNEQVRDLARSILEMHGYTILTAENGQEALGILENHDGPLHLLLTDVVMPVMNGRALFARAAQSHPDLKVLYMSGYTDNVIAHRGVLDENTAFIQKPFTIHALTAKVREILGHPQGDQAQPQ